jgi:hypothetical protein
LTLKDSLELPRGGLVERDRVNEIATSRALYSVGDISWSGRLVAARSLIKLFAHVIAAMQEQMVIAL